MNWNEYFTYKDGELFWKHRPRHHFKNDRAWNKSNTQYAGKKAGSIVNFHYGIQYKRVKVSNKLLSVHRIIYEMHFGLIADGMQIDHLDHNGLNNNIENLRIVSSSDNSKNKTIFRNNSSGVTGVSYIGKIKKWKSEISINGKRFYLGVYTNINDAVSARKQAEHKHGFHANHGTDKVVR